MVGIGANGSNHAMAHVIDIAQLADVRPRFNALARAFEEILTRGHLPPRDSGVILYNLACDRPLAGETDDARRLLSTAFAHRHELVESAKEDPDLAVLTDEMEMLTDLLKPGSSPVAIPDGRTGLVVRSKRRPSLSPGI